MSKREISDSLNEIRFLASIRHKNIVGFYEVSFFLLYYYNCIYAGNNISSVIRFVLCINHFNELTFLLFFILIIFSLKK